MVKKIAQSHSRPAHKRSSTLPSMPDTKVRTWLLVADGAGAAFYNVAAVTARVTAIPDMSFGQKSKPSRAMMSDRPGRTKYSAGQRRSAMEPRTDPHVQAETEFLKRVAVEVNAGVRKKLFDQLIIAAPPRAMAELRTTLNKTSRAKVALEITHEWNHFGVRELSTRVKAALAPR